VKSEIPCRHCRDLSWLADDDVLCHPWCHFAMEEGARPFCEGCKASTSWWTPSYLHTIGSSAQSEWKGCSSVTVETSGGIERQLGSLIDKPSGRICPNRNRRPRASSQKRTTVTNSYSNDPGKFSNGLISPPPFIQTFAVSIALSPGCRLGRLTIPHLLTSLISRAKHSTRKAGPAPALRTVKSNRSPSCRYSTSSRCGRHASCRSVLASIARFSVALASRWAAATCSWAASTWSCALSASSCVRFAIAYVKTARMSVAPAATSCAIPPTASQLTPVMATSLARDGCQKPCEGPSPLTHTYGVKSRNDAELVVAAASSKRASNPLTKQCYPAKIESSRLTPRSAIRQGRDAL
jgi:hypothetical protein